MANTVTKLTDANKITVWRFTGDASEGRTIKIDAGMLAYALNANGRISSTAGTDRKSQYRLALKKIIYDVNGGPTNGYVALSTDGDSPNNVFFMSTGQATIAFNEGGDTVTSNLNIIANTTGNVYLATVGFSGNCSYCITAFLRKEPLDFDAGQTADPMAFNQGLRATSAQNT